MSYLVLARKWRPRQFKELTGQDVIVRTLKNALASDHLAHAYLLTGIRGVGKTTISRLMAMAVNCAHADAGEPCSICESCVSIAKGNNLDVQEMDAASHTSVDDIREILDGVRYPPVHLKRKVYIIDEAHMLSKSAFNALLKTLEEPPESILFILATTESDKLPITVRSRCQRFDLRRLNVDEISNYLRFVLHTEGVKADEDALQVIARSADGSVRDALSLTERVLAFSGKHITIADVQQSLGLIGSEQTQHLCQAVLSGDAKAAIEVLRQGRELGLSPAKLLQALSEQWHEMMCCKLDESLAPQGMSADTKAWLIQVAGCWSEQALDMRYQVLIHGLRDIYLVDEQRGAEMIVARLCHLNTISQALASMPSGKHPAPGQPKPTPPANTLSTPLHVTEVNATDDVGIKKNTEQHLSNEASWQQTPPWDIEVPSKDTLKPAPAANTAPEQPAEVNMIPLPTSWAEAMAFYHKLKPGVAAILEHSVCASFEPELHISLDSHQWSSLTEVERNDFQTWIQRPVFWQHNTGNAGESLIKATQRQAEEATRKLWQQAEAEPHIQAIKAAFGCRIVSVEPPAIHFETTVSTNDDGDVEPIEDSNIDNNNDDDELVDSESQIA